MNDSGGIQSIQIKNFIATQETDKQNILIL